MPLELGFPTDEEFPQFIPSLFEALGGGSAFVNAVWPNGFTKEGQEMTRQRFLFLKQMFPTIQWCKITDTDTGEIIGVAQWNIYRDEKPAEGDVDGPPGTWANEVDKEYAQAIFRSFIAERRRIIRSESLPIICLDIMSVTPKHQYRGAGTMLMKWGMELADEIGALCILEASNAGRWLYEQNGFRVDKHWSLPLPEKFANRPTDRLFLMTRPRKSV